MSGYHVNRVLFLGLFLIAGCVDQMSKESVANDSEILSKLDGQWSGERPNVPGMSVEFLKPLITFDTVTGTSYIESLPVRDDEGTFTGDAAFTVERYGPKDTWSILLIIEDCNRVVLLKPMKDRSNNMYLEYTVSTVSHDVFVFTHLGSESRLDK